MKPSFPCNLLVILGPTASGKTRLGVGAAARLDGEIISADSRQVFRGMDLGTGKDLEEYGAVPVHLIDILDPGEEFSVFEFQRRFLESYRQILARGRLPVLVGGTGLYLDAVLRNYRLVAVPENPRLRAELAPLSDRDLAGRLQQLKPALHNTTDLTDRRRLLRAIEIAEGERRSGPPEVILPDLAPLVFGLRWPRQTLRRRIADRLHARLEKGLIDEVARLHAAGLSWQSLDYYGLEYRFVARHLRGELTRNDLFQQLNSAIGQFAKRQETWFRRMERQGVKIHWLEGDGDALATMLEVLGEC